MSNTQFAFIKKEDVPGKDAWQEAIDQLDFDIRLGIDPAFSSFWRWRIFPCSWRYTYEEVEPWPEKLYVDKVEMPEKNIIEVSFTNVPNILFRFYALDAMLFNMSFQTESLRFSISNDECELTG